MFISSFGSKLLLGVLVSFPSLLIPWIFCFISLWVSFICFFIFRPSSISSVSILINRTLNSPPERLAISSLSSPSEVFHIFLTELCGPLSIIFSIQVLCQMYVLEKSPNLWLAFPFHLKKKIYLLIFFGFFWGGRWNINLLFYLFMHSLVASLKYFIFIHFWEMGRERERERNIDMWEKHRLASSHTPSSQDPAHNPGMCSDCSVCRTWPKPWSHTRQGHGLLLICALTRDQTRHLGVSEQCSTQLSYPARACLLPFLIMYFCE